MGPLQSPNTLWPESDPTYVSISFATPLLAVRFLLPLTHVELVTGQTLELVIETIQTLGAGWCLRLQQDPFERVNKGARHRGSP